MNRLKDKVAIITGGASGIGKATAVRFAQEGASIAVWDVQEEKGQEVVKSLAETGAKAIFYKVNTADSAMVYEAVKAVTKDFGKIDILINNAGILRDATLLKMTEEQFDLVVDVNLKGVFNCTKAVAPVMVERGYGRIVQASSVVGLYGKFRTNQLCGYKSWCHRDDESMGAGIGAQRNYG